MKKVGLYTIALCLILHGCNLWPKKKTVLLNDEAIYPFINAIDSQITKQKCFVISKKVLNPSIGDNVPDSIRGMFDTTAYKGIEDSAKKFSWKQEKIAHIILVNTDSAFDLKKWKDPDDTSKCIGDSIDSAWRRFYKKYSGSGIVYFSVPLFSKDGMLCLMQYRVEISRRNAYGGIGYFKKVNGSWNIVDVYRSWIAG